MEEYFSREIKNLKREIVNLKTLSSKSAGVVPTASKSMSAGISLGLNQQETMASGRAEYRVVSEDSALIMATLDWYNEDVYKSHLFPAETRRIVLLKTQDNSGNVIILLLATGDMDDITALRNGQSVSIQATLTVRATSSFSLERIL